MIESPVGQVDQAKANEGRPRWMDFLAPMKTTAVGANVVLAALSAGLAVWADGTGRWLLGVLVAASVLLLLGQVGVVWLRLHRRARDQLVEIRHQQELSAAQADLARTTERAAAAAAELSGLQALRGRYAAALAALHDMWLGYPAPYTDDLELTYLVGVEASGDRVIEHRRTTPDPGAALPCLESRLTTPTQLDAEAVALVDVEMVTRSEDDRIAIRQIALTEKPNLLRCLFVFRPSITEPTSWYARYRMPGMWDVLRASGHDSLTWTPAPRVGDRVAVDAEPAGRQLRLRARGRGRRVRPGPGQPRAQAGDRSGRVAALPVGGGSAAAGAVRVGPVVGPLAGAVIARVPSPISRLRRRRRRTQSERASQPPRHRG